MNDTLLPDGMQDASAEDQYRPIIALLTDIKLSANEMSITGGSE